MAGSAVALVVSSVVTDYVAEAAAFTLLDAGLAVGSEILVGNVIGGAAGMVAGSLAGNVVRSAFTSPPGSVTDQAARGTLINSSSNVAALPIVYGSRRVGGTRILMEASGSSNETLHIVLAIAEGEIDAISTIYLDDTPITDPKFSAFVYSESYTGTDTQSASQALINAIPDKWTSAHKGSGIAYVYVRLKYDKDTFSSLPTVTADVRGRKVYDPRTGITAYSNNPALCIRDYLTSQRYGRGISQSLIDDASFIIAANHCDELVSIPGGTQTRYTCDGMVDINSTLFDNTKNLLTSCRGMLIYSGGKYKLAIDKLTASTFDFTESNIVGSWTISQSGRRNRFNRVTAGFYNGSRNWQQDLAISDSSAYRGLDNSLLLESKVDLPYTSDLYKAQQLAGLTLKQSRFGLSVKFTAMQEGLRVEAADVVTITHSTPGWTAKKFRVIQVEILDSDEVSISAIEYDDSVYNLDALTAITGVPASNLPNPMSVQTPGLPSASEALYQTTGSAGVKTRVAVTFASIDAFAVGQRLSWRPVGGAWFTVPDQQQPFFTLDDVAPGAYEFRAATINAFGIASSWTAAVSKTIIGLTAVPQDVTGFTVIKSTGFALAEWDLQPDLDVRIGGRIAIRHSPLTSGVAWENGVVVQEFNGDSVSGNIPLMTGTYMVKAKDSSGNWSKNAAYFVATSGMVTGFNVAATTTQSSAFAGSKSGVAVLNNMLVIDGSVTIGSMTTSVSTWGRIASLGGVLSLGSYYFDQVVDVATTATRRFEASIQALSYDTGDTIGARGNVSDWDSVAGSAINDCDVTLYVSTTNDDPAGAPTWTSWAPFFVGDFTCRAAKFRLDLASGQKTHNIGISLLKVDVKTPA